MNISKGTVDSLVGSDISRNLVIRKLSKSSIAKQLFSTQGGSSVGVDDKADTSRASADCIKVEYSRTGSFLRVSVEIEKEREKLYLVRPRQFGYRRSTRATARLILSRSRHQRPDKLMSTLSPRENS